MPDFLFNSSPALFRTLVIGVIAYLGLIVFLRISAMFGRLVKSSPALLLYKGKVCQDVLLRERVTVSELHATLRGKGITDIEQVGAVVLETDGSFSIVAKIDDEESGSGRVKSPAK